MGTKKLMHEPRHTHKSIAYWTKIPPSEDTHISYAHAKAICMRLQEEYGHGRPPCSIRGNVIKTEVKEIENGLQKTGK